MRQITDIWFWSIRRLWTQIIIHIAGTFVYSSWIIILVLSINLHSILNFLCSSFCFPTDSNIQHILIFLSTFSLFIDFYLTIYFMLFTFVFLKINMHKIEFTVKDWKPLLFSSQFWFTFCKMPLETWSRHFMWVIKWTYHNFIILSSH